MMRVFKKIESPVGPLFLVATEMALEAVCFAKNWPKYKVDQENLSAGENKIIKLTEQQFGEYWQGRRQHFSIPLTLRGTDFQLKAWKALSTIPYGQTWSYKQQAVAIRAAKAVRAVGSANGRNPISIIIPCHRVIATNKKLAGYGGGLNHKEFLLRHEKAEFISEA